MSLCPPPPPQPHTRDGRARTQVQVSQPTQQPCWQWATHVPVVMVQRERKETEEPSCRNDSGAARRQSPCYHETTVADKLPDLQSDWDTFFKEATMLLRSRRPKTRNLFLKDVIPSLAADAMVTTPHRADLFIELLRAYCLNRDRRSRLALYAAGDALLKAEAQHSSDLLCDSRMVQRAINLMKEEVAHLERDPDRGRDKRSKGLLLHACAIRLLQRVVWSDAKEELQTSENWEVLVFTYARTYDFLQSLAPPPNDKFQYKFRRTCHGSMHTVHEALPLIMETLTVVSDWAPSPTPALTTLGIIVEACLRLAEKGEVAGSEDSVGRSYVRQEKVHILHAFAKHITGPSLPLPKRVHRACCLFLYAECPPEEFQAHFLPGLERAMCDTPESALVAGIEMTDLYYPREDNYLPDTFREVLYCGSDPRMRAGSKEPWFSSFLHPRCYDALVTALISGDPRTREAGQRAASDYDYRTSGRPSCDDVANFLRSSGRTFNDDQRKGIYMLFDMRDPGRSALWWILDHMRAEEDPSVFKAAVTALCGEAKNTFFR